MVQELSPGCTAPRIQHVKCGHFWCQGLWHLSLTVLNIVWVLKKENHRGLEWHEWSWKFHFWVDCPFRRIVYPKNVILSSCTHPGNLKAIWIYCMKHTGDGWPHFFHVIIACSDPTLFVPKQHISCPYVWKFLLFLNCVWVNNDRKFLFIKMKNCN